MKDNTVVSLIVALIASATSIIVAVMNNNSMKELFYTEVFVTQTAEAQSTADASHSSFFLPTMQPSPSGNFTAPLSTESITPTLDSFLTLTPTSLPAPDPIVKNSEVIPDDSLTFRFRELSILISVFFLIGIFIFFFIKVDDGSSLSFLSRILLAIVAIFPILLFWFRFVLSLPSLPWMTVLFSTFMPMSALLWLVAFFDNKVSNASALIFAVSAVIAPFITSFGFTFWPIGTAILNAIIAIVCCAIPFGIAIFTLK